MKKIAIITLHDVKNYGSILQAYATQCYFENLGLEPVIIDYRRPWETTFGYWFYLNEKSLKGVARNVLYFPSKILQLGPFRRFRNKYLKLTQKSYKSAQDLKKDPVAADYYCTGSDQVWNSGWNNGVIAEYFLNFVDVNTAKKISFAASMGRSEISGEEKAAIKPLLEDYNLITVREKQSAKMLEEELGLEAFEILDPTLQMDGAFWRKLCRPERAMENKYVLLIQLNRNHAFDQLAVQFAKQRNLMLVRLCLRVDQMVLPGKCVLLPEVEDYVRLVRDAEYVLTDSFHAVSFCVNLEKQFFVYYPEKYSERLKSLLSILRLPERTLNGTVTENPIEYEAIHSILGSKRSFAKQKIEEVIING